MRSSQPGVPGVLARFYQRASPVMDFVALAVIWGSSVLIQKTLKPSPRLFMLDDKDIQHPLTSHERVTVQLSMIYAGLIPLLTIIAWAALTRPSRYQIQVTLLGLFTSLMLSSLLTDIIKNSVGRPRPDLVARCLPQKGTPEDVWVSLSVCTQENKGMLLDGFRSFPSGHSSFSFSGLGYFSFFLAGQMRVFRPRSDLCRCLLAFLPLFGAFLIGLSRLADYRHDIYDVTTGSLLGLGVAYFTYRRFYPSLGSVTCDVTKDRDEDLSTSGFSKLPDDEEQQIRDVEEYQLDEASSSRGP
ncbi:phosphatase PAP2 family protein [Aspergillus candidus]|uniref:PAP2 domain protein n=1 Tax=Aspergillus candidus TaxID=41067 RepID=A0A2I2FKX9_ASPCN|nr:PAP2 domain protein [Aspergillus candidus]PLB41281.1 PAP2 domain protein [Aspergillus candidus]